MIEELLDKSWLFLRASQVRACVLEHFLLIVWPFFLGGTLDVLIQVFSWIHVGTRGRQRLGVYPIRVFPDPVVDSSPAMHGMPVVDENHFPRRLPQRPSQEFDHHLSGECSGEHHKPQMPLVGNGRDHVTAKPLARTRDDGRLAAAPVAATASPSRPASEFRPFLATLAGRWPDIALPARGARLLDPAHRPFATASGE